MAIITGYVNHYGSDALRIDACILALVPADVAHCERTDDELDPRSVRLADQRVGGAEYLYPSPVSDSQITKTWELRKGALKRAWLAHFTLPGVGHSWHAAGRRGLADQFVTRKLRVAPFEQWQARQDSNLGPSA